MAVGLGGAFFVNAADARSPSRCAIIHSSCNFALPCTPVADRTWIETSIATVSMKSYLRPVLASAILLERVHCIGVSDLRVEGMPQPMLLDAAAPRFAWSVVDVAPNAQLSAYRILVGVQPGLSSLSLIWDSGEVPISAAVSSVAYAGANVLQSATEYYWRADVQTCNSTRVDSAGLADIGCAWSNSSVSRFGMGLLQLSDWHNASWIGGFPQMRGAFNLQDGQAVVRARVFVSAVGSYQLWANGQLIDRDGYNQSSPPAVLSPGYSTIFSSRLLYNAYDITSNMISGGENVIGVRIGDGKYGYLTEFCTAGSDACNAAIVAVVIESRVDAANGTNTTWFVSTGDWTGTSSSPITYQRLFIGESYDARLEQAGSSSPGFSNASKWTPVAVRSTSPTAMLTAHTMAQVSVIGETPALSVVQTAATRWLFDTGVNGAGSFRLRIAGPVIQSGVTISIALGERTTDRSYDPEGPRLVNIFPCPAPCCPKGGGCSSMVFNYTTRGSGSSSLHGSAAGVDNAADEVYTPTFSTGGYRFAEVTVVGASNSTIPWPGSTMPTAADFVRLSMSSATEPASTVTFDTISSRGHHAGTGVPASSGAEAAILNELQAAVVATQAANLFSHPTDCPHRERRGWGGDASLTVHEALLNFNLQAFYENWLRTMADTQVVQCGNMTSGNTCDVFHDRQSDALTSSTTGAENILVLGNTSTIEVGPLAATLPSNGPGQRPDCYLCCPAEKAAGGGFGCAYLGYETAGSLPDIMPVNGPSRSWPGSITWTSVAFTVADSLWRTYGDVQAVNNSFPMLWNLLVFYNNAANANHSSPASKQLRAALLADQSSRQRRAGHEQQHGDAQGHSAAPGVGPHLGDLPAGLLPFEAYGDWLAPSPSSPLFMANAYYIYCTNLLAQMAVVTGRTAEAVALAALSSALNELIAASYLKISNTTSGHDGSGDGAAATSPADSTSTTGVWDTGSQAAHAAALWMQLGGTAGTSPNVTQAVLDHLVADVTSRNYTVSVGTLGSRFVLQALTQYGRGDVALSLATSTAYPSWAYMLYTNASGGNASASYPGQAVGTLWECWSGKGCSLDHGMYGGGIGEWIIESAVGLRIRHSAAPAPGAPISVLQGAAGARHGARIGTACLNQWRSVCGDELLAAGMSHRHICAAARLGVEVRNAIRSSASLASSARPGTGAAASALSLRRLKSRAALMVSRMSDVNGVGLAAASMQAPQLIPSVTLVLEDAAVRRLRDASATLLTSFGKVSAAWAFRAPPLVPSSLPSMATPASPPLLSMDLSSPSGMPLTAHIAISTLLSAASLPASANLQDNRTADEPRRTNFSVAVRHATCGTSSGSQASTDDGRDAACVMQRFELRLTAASGNLVQVALEDRGLHIAGTCTGNNNSRFWRAEATARADVCNVHSAGRPHPDGAASEFVSFRTARGGSWSITVEPAA